MDWAHLKFEFTPTPHLYVARTRPRRTTSRDHATSDRLGATGHETDHDLEWVQGDIEDFHPIALSPAAAALNYAQIGFEGLKAVRSATGNIVLFRPAENARRLRQTAARLAMPPFPADWFVSAVEDLVRTEALYVPPYHEAHWPADCPPGSRSLYIRPVMLGSGPTLGVKPASEYTFYIFVSPVGVYRDKGSLVVLDATHRAPAHGLGDVKAAANYPATLRPSMTAQDEHCVDVLYLDARHDTYVEEVGSSNFFAVLKDGTLVTPRAGSILPGITRDSVITLADQVFGWHVVQRDISIQEVLDDADEAFFTGTAAVIVPVTDIRYKGIDHSLPMTRHRAHAAQEGPPATVAGMLKRKLTDIQLQRVDDPFGWVHVVA